MPVRIERWMDGWIDACIYDMFTLLYFFSLNMSLLRCVFMYNVCMPVCIERWMDGWIDACIYDMYVCLCRVVRSIHTAACTHSCDVFCFITRLYSSVALKQKACLCANAENIAEDLHQGCTGDLWHTTYHIIYFQYSLCLCFFFSSLRELSSSIVQQKEFVSAVVVVHTPRDVVASF